MSDHIEHCACCDLRDANPDVHARGCSCAAAQWFAAIQAATERATELESRLLTLQEPWKSLAESERRRGNRAEAVLATIRDKTLFWRMEDDFKTNLLREIHALASAALGAK